MLFSLNVLVYYRPGDLLWGVPRILVSVCGESGAEHSGQHVREHFAKESSAQTQIRAKGSDACMVAHPSTAQRRCSNQRRAHQTGDFVGCERKGAGGGCFASRKGRFLGQNQHLPAFSSSVFLLLLSLPSPF
jgi:hypothetical protein